MAVLRKIAAVFFLLVRLKTEVTAQTVTTQAAVQDCPRGLYQCDSGLCISTNWRCNGRDNCGDGSDERDCTTTTAGSHTLSVTTTLENNPTTQDTSTSATSSTHHLTTTDSTTVQPLATTAESQTSSVTITLANNPTTQATSTDAISSTPHLTTIVPTTVQPLATTAQAGMILRFQVLHIRMQLGQRHQVCYKGQRSEDQGRLALQSPTPPSPCRSVQLTPPTTQGTN
uniref:Uncharacterized protein n=1 Tax=Branchiostoma floridae TaxID=7739 RepID=C3XPG4_BRAFL|eukprot:XP_002613826.1 hypothetical protein BRAFLDRAFT_72053 [Branchiostoma floridae]